jgi:DNA-binding protein WhiA
METAYGAGAKLMVGEGAAVRRARVYELSVPPGPAADSILVASGIIRLAGGKREMREGHPDFAFGRKCCRKACMKGLFLGVGVVSDPEKGYNFEMAFTSEATASAARRLLNSFTGLRARVRRRRSSYVVYLKNSEQIRDALAIMGAHAQLLKFEEVRMVRGMKGHVNRLGNCDAANMDRALGAAERQLAQIRSIEARDGLDSLPDELIDTALTRIFHPDASLAEIGRLLIPPVGKAAVGARFKRIAEYAADSWPS